MLLTFFYGGKVMFIQETTFGTHATLGSMTYEGVYDDGNHIHQLSEIVFVLGGELGMTVEGKTEIGRQGDVFLITPFKMHSFFTKEYCKILIVVFSNDFATGLISEDALYRGRDTALFTPSHDVAEYVGNRFYDATRDFLNNVDAEANYLRAKTCIHMLLNEYVDQTTLNYGGKKTETLGAICLYIAQHYREKISLDTISHALGYTKGHISHCFEAIPNFNFNGMVNSLRVEYAKNLMLTTNYRNIDLALESGFTCERSFHRAFKKFTSMTPGEYLKSKKEAYLK